MIENDRIRLYKYGCKTGGGGHVKFYPYEKVGQK